MVVNEDMQPWQKKMIAPGLQVIGWDLESARIVHSVDPVSLIELQYTEGLVYISPIARWTGEP